MNTFKKPNKTTGTAHSSDGEAATTNTQSINSVSTLTNEDKNEVETMSTDSSSLLAEDKKRPTNDVSNTSTQSSQQTIKLSQQLSESTHFDPLISTDSGNLQELETLLKSTFQKAPPNDEMLTISPQVSTNTDDLSDLKSLIMDMSRNLLTKMNIIETKIDEHFTQTRKINHTITNTILPSLMDLTDIIQETSATSNLDVRVKSKLENIQTRIRSTQQQQNDMKDLMDI